MKKILIALDYNPSAQKVAETGHKLAKAMNANTFLLHVFSDASYYSSLSYSPIMGFDGFNDLDVIQSSTVEKMQRAVQNYLDKTKHHLEDETIHTVVRKGDFAETILSTATELNIDIIVMGSHSRHGLDKILSGRVAEKVLHHSSIPIFIIPVNDVSKNL